MAATALFDVQVGLEAAGATEDAAELVTSALGEAIPLEGVEGRAAVRTTERGVTIRFEGVAAPADGEAQFRLHEVLPVVQALISGIMERVATGEPPANPRLVIEVQPAKTHDQQELRHS